jgi:hypothetical protein
MLPQIQYRNQTIVYVADLLPSAAHIPVSYVMAYDTRPLITLSEKESFLNDAVNGEYILFFEHDPVHECGNLKKTDRGVRLNNAFGLSEITG